MNTIPKQTKQFRADVFEDGKPLIVVATVRHDDECGNGHNTFSITGEIYETGGSARDGFLTHKCGRHLPMSSCGCVHDDIAKHIPELAPFIKWHLTSTDGPMHYIANTVYHATQHGPKSAWVYFDDPPNGIKKECVKYCDVPEALAMCEVPSKTFNYVSGVGYRLEYDLKTAKEANLDHARSSAVWPEATDEDLLCDEPELTAKLKARLPALMKQFKADVESLGFTY